MNKFIDDWGTEVALVIAVIGAFYILWLSWPERERMGFLWRLIQTAVVFAVVAVGLYGYLALNGVML
jgi:hypothetical protein